jgi:hypothetical protein
MHSPQTDRTGDKAGLSTKLSSPHNFSTSACEEQNLSALGLIPKEGRLNFSGTQRSYFGSPGMSRGDCKFSVR